MKLHVTEAANAVGDELFHHLTTTVAAFKRLQDTGQHASRTLRALVADLSELQAVLHQYYQVLSVTGQAISTTNTKEVSTLLDQIRECLEQQQQQQQHHVLTEHNAGHTPQDVVNDLSPADHELTTLRPAVFQCCLNTKNVTFVTILKAACVEAGNYTRSPRPSERTSTFGHPSTGLSSILDELAHVWSSYHNHATLQNDVRRPAVKAHLESLEQKNRSLMSRTIAFVGLESHPDKHLTIPELMERCSEHHQQTAGPQVTSIWGSDKPKGRDAVPTTLQRTVIIRLPRHQDIEAHQYQMLDDSCCWLDANGVSVLEHVFFRAAHERCPWKKAGTHSDFTVAFTLHQMHGSQIRCHVPEHATHKNQAPEYIFGHKDDYELFQGRLRKRVFLGEFEMPSIKTNGSMRTHTSRDEFIKLWSRHHEDGDITLTIPVTFEGYEVRIIEVSLRWMTWDKPSAAGVRLVFRQPSRPSSGSFSLSSSPSESSTKSKSFMRRLSGLTKSPTWQNGPTLVDEHDIAPEDLTAKYHHFALEFKDPSLKNQFVQLFEPGGSTRLLSSATSMQSMTSVTLPSPAQTPAHKSTTKPLQHRNLAPPLPKPPSLLLPDPLAHEILRRGGPKTNKLISTSSPSGIEWSHSFYQDLPTESDTIRLLRIDPGRSESLVAVSMEYHVLADAPQYEALSYCWQKSGGTRTIEAGSLRGFRVSEHVWSALRRLRQRQKVRYVWIDAICINQDDIDERNTQIVLMPKIYSRAFRTVIWIGDFRPEVTTCSRGELAEDEVEPTLCALLGLSALEHKDVSQDLRRDLLALQEIDDRNDLAAVWWKRLWCIQEFYFSQRPPTVYIGPHAIRWQHFGKLFDVNDDPLTLFHGLQRGSMQSPSLHDLLALTGRFRCTDPRDRIYALLGMAQQAAGHLEADYRVSVIRIIEDACMFLIRESSSLDVLLDSRTSRAVWSSGIEAISGIMPTWIPDLSCLQTLRTSRSADNFEAGRGQPMVRLSARADASTQPSAEFDVPRMLHIKAVYFGTIKLRTSKSDIPEYERSPDENVIYNSLLHRGEIIEKILNVLQYDYQPHELYASHRELDPSPCLGRLFWYYVFGGGRSMVEELERRARGEQRDVITTYERQEREDVGYVKYEGSVNDMAYVRERWDVKKSRAEAKEMLTPGRLKAALATENRNIVLDFMVARDLENLLAYARHSTQHYYFTGSNFDAPMRKDVLATRNLDDVKKLPTQYDNQGKDFEFYEYDAKQREQDFFKTEPGSFLGLGPASLEEEDIVVVPFGSSRPWILRKRIEATGEQCYTFIGECIIPSIMSGRWMQETEDVLTYCLK